VKKVSIPKLLVIGHLAMGYLAILHALLPAQPASKILRHAVSCPSCRVEFTRILTVGSPSDPATIASLSALARDGQGRYFAFSDDSRLIVYDSNGRFLRTVGRRGEGPGEFSGVPGLLVQIPPHVRVGMGDSIFIFDPPRITVFSPGLDYVRTARIDPPLFSPLGMSPLADGSWLVAAQVFTPDNVGYATHVLGSNGAIVRSVGPEAPVGPRTPAPIPRHFVVSPDQRSFWTVSFSTGRYKLEEWSITGGMMRSLEVTGVPYLTEPEFENVAARAGGTVRRAIGGAGGVNLTGFDAAGRLWITISRPGSLPEMRDWRPGMPIPKRLLPVVLEILDLKTGDILLSHSMEKSSSLLWPGIFAVAQNTDADGLPSYELLRYRITGR
jgi:hypothetical protein